MDLEKEGFNLINQFNISSQQFGLKSGAYLIFFRPAERDVTIDPTLKEFDFLEAFYNQKNFTGIMNKYNITPELLNKVNARPKTIN